jgi:hypothetical protein
MIGEELAIPSWLPDEWGSLFGTGTTLNAAGYPTKDELVAALSFGQSMLIGWLDDWTDTDLDQPLPDVRYREVFPTLGSAVLHILTVHTAVHLGQLSAWRRAMGLPPVPDPL